MAAPRKFTAEEIASAVTDARGILSQAARALGCSRNTIANYINRYATVKAAYDEANETNIDFVESKLMSNINSGDTTAIIFFLKTKAKARGYVERQEHTGKDGKDLPIVVIQPGMLDDLK